MTAPTPEAVEKLAREMSDCLPEIALHFGRWDRVARFVLERFDRRPEPDPLQELVALLESRGHMTYADLAALVLSDIDKVNAIASRRKEKNRE